MSEEQKEPKVTKAIIRAKQAPGKIRKAVVRKACCRGR